MASNSNTDWLVHEQNFFLCCMYDEFIRQLYVQSLAQIYLCMYHGTRFLCTWFTQAPEYKFVMSQVEEQSGLKIGQEQEVICHLWSTREGTYRQLRHWESILRDLNLRDNNVTEGLKVNWVLLSVLVTKYRSAYVCPYFSWWLFNILIEEILCSKCILKYLWFKGLYFCKNSHSTYLLTSNVQWMTIHFTELIKFYASTLLWINTKIKSTRINMSCTVVTWSSYMSVMHEYTCLINVHIELCIVIKLNIL